MRDFSNYIYQFLAALCRPQRFHGFSIHLHFPYLGDLCSSRLFVEYGEEDVEGEGRRECFPLVCHDFVSNLVALSINEEIEHLIGGIEMASQYLYFAADGLNPV